MLYGTVFSVNCNRQFASFLSELQQLDNTINLIGETRHATFRVRIRYCPRINRDAAEKNRPRTNNIYCDFPKYCSTHIDQSVGFESCVQSDAEGMKFSLLASFAGDSIVDLGSGVGWASCAPRGKRMREANAGSP